MKVFIAEATGVLGRRVVPPLVARGRAVTAVARGPQKAASLVRQGASPVTIDPFEPDVVAAAVGGHDVVINLATAIPPPSICCGGRRGARRSGCGPMLHAAVLGELPGRRVRPLPSAPLMGGPLALWARSQRLSNRRLRGATGWRATYPSRRAGWIEVLAALEEVTAVA